MSYGGKLAVMVSIALPISYVFWIVFVGTFSAHELEVGIIAALLAVAGTAVIDVQYPSRFAPSIGELLACWRLPWYLVSGTWEILRVAAMDFFGIRRAQSLFLVVPFDSGKLNDERAVARRVLAVSYTTMTPNSVVLGINVAGQKLLVHQFERTPMSRMTRSLGAQA
jgi:multisubunit Na+/H+ antiporter MnhE subunit